tara:strand:+ start:1519 stop:2799 length:1281 start_codon:yes stop_codon:yes gene_type:complete
MTISFLQGDVFDKLKELDDNSIDCVVTSPPYWGLRDYGTAKWQGGDLNCSHSYGRNTRGGLTQFQKNNKGSFGDEAIKSGEHCKLCGAKRIDKQLGLEPTYQEHIQNIIELFRAMKPKLKDSATIWLNYGDSYAATVNGTKAKDIKNDDRGFVDKPFSTIQGSIKPKDLVMIPNRIAIALQDDGWWIRSEIIWHKPNPMPESTKDRPTSAHEKIWLITKSKKYYYDADAIKEPTKFPNAKANWTSKQRIERAKSLNRKPVGNEINKKKYNGQSFKNKRNVWTITTKPCKEAHFATFPKDLIEPCVKAGCPEKVCVECGKPQVKEFYRKEKYNPGYGNQHTPKGTHKKIGGVYQKWLEENPPKITIKPSCDCNKGFKSGVVLDPFGGAGTTGIVAKQFNRTAILIELNSEYIKIAKKRIDKELGMFK